MTTKKAIPRLTASRAESLPAGEYTDPACAGLQLRVREGAKDTTRTWLFRYKWRGRPLRVTLGHLPAMPLSDARERAIEMRRHLDDGVDPRRARPRRIPVKTAQSVGAAVGDPTNRHSIETLVHEFVERHLKPTRKRPEYAIRILNTEVLSTWRGRDARTIEPAEVIDLLDQVVERGSRVMANRTAAILGQLFKFGIHRRIVAATPVQLLYRPGGKEKPRERNLSDDEIKMLMASLDELARSTRTAHVLRILLLTGQRRSEIALALWSNVDLDARTWLIPDVDAKAGRGHVVPLSDLAVDEFQTLKRLAKRSAFVFPNEDGSAPADPKLITRSVARYQSTWRELGIKPFTPHDLRRTCRTGLAKLKVAPHIAERVLNHAQEKIPGTYDVHDYLDEKREALEKWAVHLQGLRT